MIGESYNTIIHRGALMPGGILYRPDRIVPDDLAYVLSNGAIGGRRVVTWAEVIEERRKQQASRLIQKRYVKEWRPYKIWVAYYAQFLMGGWHAFIENRYGREWIDRDREWLRPRLMDLFPLVLRLKSSQDSFGYDEDDFHRWKIEFAKQFKRRSQCRRPVGVAYIWWNGCPTENLRLTYPACLPSGGGPAIHGNMPDQGTNIFV